MIVRNSAINDVISRSQQVPRVLIHWKVVNVHYDCYLSLTLLLHKCTSEQGAYGMYSVDYIDSPCINQDLQLTSIQLGHCCHHGFLMSYASG